MPIPSEFHINFAKFQDYSNRALDWFIKGLKFEYGSDKWKICNLKQKIYAKKAKRYLEKANKYLNEWI